MFGRRHHDDVDVGVLGDLAPVGGALAEAEAGDAVVDPGEQRVAADDELGVERSVWEVHRDAAHRPAVGLTHPAEADHAHPEAPAVLAVLTDSRVLVRRSWGSADRAAIPSQLARTQWWVGSSQNAIVRSGAGPASTLR